MKDYEQIISTLLTKIANLEKVVIQQAVRIADLEKRLDNSWAHSHHWRTGITGLSRGVKLRA